MLHEPTGPIRARAGPGSGLRPGGVSLRVMKRRILLPAAGVSALAAITMTIAACGGGDSSGSDSSKPTTTLPAGAVEVDAVAGLKFDAEEYTATATDGSVTIAYVNEDTQRHTLVVKDSDGIIIGDKLEVNKKGDLEVGTYQLAPGEYTIYCDVPGHGGMKATLTVS